MSNELALRRKFTLRAHGSQIVFIKRKNERTAHVLMKALLWALYLPRYPNLQIEIPIGDRYKPDVVELDRQGEPRFWGEAGQVSLRKLRSLLRRFRHTHFAFAKWDTSLDPYRELVEEVLEDVAATRPDHAAIDLLRFPPDSKDRFIDVRGAIEIDFTQLEWFRLG